MYYSYYHLFILSIILIAIINRNHANHTDYYFPDAFQFGVATAAYQIEGAWQTDGKLESIWDRGTHDHADWVADQTNGDIACDSYHKYREDVQMLRALGVHFYRFSVSWPRIIANDSTAAIAYYNALIDELLANGIEPHVTIYHWDLPQMYQDQDDGWLNPNRDVIIDLFVDYARVLFRNFGDRVKVWMTFNEIMQICEAGYGGGSFAPFRELPGVGGYKCTHTVLIAHARVYRMYETEFKPDQNGQVGIAIDSYWHEPNDPDNQLDREAAELSLQMNYGWFAHPVLRGNYPPVMIERIRNVSLSEGYEQSRLPVFTDNEINMINGSFDFLGLNHYTSERSYFADEDAGDHPSHWADIGVIGVQDDPTWGASASDWLKVVPWGLRKLLIWINENYDNPPVLITENGFSDLDGCLVDDGRISYHRQYLDEVLKAIHEDGCNVIGYTAWSLMDNFEWMAGYTQRFGLYYVNFTDPERPRTPKKSSYVYNNIIKTRHIDWEYNPITSINH